MAEQGEVTAAVFGYLFSLLAIAQGNGSTLSQLYQPLHYHIFEDVSQGNGQTSQQAGKLEMSVFIFPSLYELLELA